MTRDEAIEKARVPFGSGTNYLVDALAALGVIKLDEPKTPEDELLEALIDVNDDFGLDPNDVLTAIKSSGLKVVRA